VICCHKHIDRARKSREQCSTVSRWKSSNARRKICEYLRKSAAWSNGVNVVGQEVVVDALALSTVFDRVVAHANQRQNHREKPRISLTRRRRKDGLASSDGTGDLPVE